MFICLHAMMVHAQDSDSILYRRLRMKWVEEAETKYKQKLIFAFNEKEISLEEYLATPHDSIYGCEECEPLRYQNSFPMFYAYSKGHEPVLEWEYREDSKRDGNTIYPIPFYTAGGVPPRFRQGVDSLKNYLQVHRQVPDSLYKGVLTNACARVDVFLCIDEDGHIWNVRVDKIHVIYPLSCDIYMRQISPDPIELLVNSGVLSDDFGQLFSSMARDALRIVQGMPDFEPGSCYLNPVKYRIPIQIGYHKSDDIVMDFGE